MSESSDDRRQGNFQGMVETKLISLEEGQRSVIAAIDAFKERTGTRIGEAERNIDRLTGEMNIVVIIGKWVFGPIFGSAGLAAGVGVAWWILKK